MGVKKVDQPLKGNMWPEEIRSRLLHLVPQDTFHADAYIDGSPAALKRLGEALISAASAPMGSENRVNMMASDGEGYAVCIRPRSDQSMDRGPMPYAQLGHFWELER